MEREIPLLNMTHGAGNLLSIENDQRGGNNTVENDL